ncbi:MFS general substrate transporter [Meredithblackwellia eburnea MCA 4105]
MSTQNIGTQVKVPFFRGTLYAALVTGFAAFAAPGLYNAMTSTGAGGLQTPYLAMAGSAILSVMMFVSCYFGSILSNKIGLKGALIFGTSGYCMYSASLYQNNRYGTQWFVLFGSAVCGLTAGVFWAAEAAIMVTYPEKHLRGRYLSLWLAFRNAGSILGGCVNLAFSQFLPSLTCETHLLLTPWLADYSGKKTGKLDWRTYIVFVVLQALGPAIAAFLPKPETIVRKDGTQVHVAKKVSTKDEIKGLLKMNADRRILLLLPFYIIATWMLSWVGSFLTQYFSVRARALASLVAALTQITGNFLLGSFLDWKRLSLNSRAKGAFFFLFGLATLTWTWSLVIQHEYQHAKVKPALDWNDAGFGRGFGVYIFTQLLFAMTYNVSFWLIGGLATDSNEVVRIASIARAWEAGPSAIGAGMASNKHVSLMAQLIVNVVLWGVAAIPSWIVIRKIGLDADGNKVDYFDTKARDGEREQDEIEKSAGNSIASKEQA